MEKFTEFLNSFNHVDAAIIAAMITASIAAIVTIVVTIINVHYNSKMTNAQIENNSKMTNAQIENNSKMTKAQIENNSEMTKAQIVSEEIRVSLPYLKDILNELRDVYRQIKEKESLIKFDDAQNKPDEVRVKIIEVSDLALSLYLNVSPYLKEEYKNELNELYSQIDQLETSYQKTILAKNKVESVDDVYLSECINSICRMKIAFKSKFKDYLFKEISSIMGSLRVYSDVNRILNN